MRCPRLADFLPPPGVRQAAARLALENWAPFRLVLRQTNRDRIESQLLCFCKFLVLITDVA